MTEESDWEFWLIFLVLWNSTTSVLLSCGQEVSLKGEKLSESELLPIQIA